MGYKLLKRTSVLLMALVILVSSLPLHNVFAETTGTSTSTTTSSNADNTTRSMIKFFQDDRTDLQVERTSADELSVYGVFISNFFTPWQTTIADITDTKSKDGIPAQISEKFFGSGGKTKQVGEVNSKISEAILKVLDSDNKRFAMLPSKGATKPMTGEQFYEKMADKGSRKIYGTDGKEYMDLDSPSYKASLKILFGLAPEAMLSKDFGLRALNALYLDGLGNVWGSYKGAATKDYVLVLPAVLNPGTFDTGGTGYRFPASNVFSMGGAIAGGDLLQNAPEMTPYYNLKGYIPNKGTSQSLTSIFGITSPFSYVGKSDTLMKGVATNPNSGLNTYLNQEAGEKVSDKNTDLMISTKPENMPDISPYITKGNNLSESQRKKLINYLVSTTTVPLSSVSDAMYYFKVPNASSQNASDSSTGSFAEENDLIKGSTLYTGSEEPIGSSKGKFALYPNSFFPSPFDKWLKDFRDHPSKQDKMLKSILVSKYDKGSDEYKDLKKFLTTSTWGTRDSGRLNRAMSLLKSSDVYNLIPKPEDKVKVGVGKFIITYNSEPVSFAMTNNDRNTTITGAAASDSLISQIIFGAHSDAKSIRAFTSTPDGGLINHGDISANDINALSTYFYTFLNYRVFTMNKIVRDALTSKVAVGTKVKTAWSGKTYKMASPVMNGVNNYPGMYWAYMVDLLQIKANKDAKDGDPKWGDPTPFSSPHLPQMSISTLGGNFDLNDAFGNAGVSESDDKTLLEMQEDIVRKVYGLLTDGPNQYRDKLIKASQDSWVLQTHRSITGSWANNNLSVSAGGNGAYASVVGYINTPSLSDLPLTDWVTQDYVWIYILLLLFALMALIVMVIISARTIREALLTFLVMSFVLVLPQFLVSGVIGLTNSITDKMYSERFNYWAITQHQQSLTTLKKAQATSNEMDYVIAMSMEQAKNVYSNDVGVRVKWMSPKKDDNFDKIFNRNTVSQGLQQNLTLFRWLFNSYLNQEEYVYDDPLATYVYRPYNAIASDAKTNYDALSSQVVDKAGALTAVGEADTPDLEFPSYRFNLFKNPETKIQYNEPTKEDIDKVKPIATGASGDVSDNYRYWLMNNQDLLSAIFRNNYTENAGFNGSTTDPYYINFSQLTESPFYYFYDVLKQRYAYGDAKFKTALLDKSLFDVTADETTNYKLVGKTRDFLDMEGLFTYVIPFLTQGNDYVYGWEGINGKGVDLFNFEGSTAPSETDNPELKNKYEFEKAKKENLKNVWKLYTPWVDQLYTLNVMNQKVYIANKKKYVTDSLNPASYETVGRPMIFSEADMSAKSYRQSDLSDVESRIQDTLKDTKTDFYYLANYYDFDDEALVTAAAMMATFEFNKNFSEHRFVGASTEMYPQGFELKNFNYDAFMRLMLINSTGEPLNSNTSSDDLYSRVLNNTSIVTGLLLIICDVLGVYVIPIMKYGVLLLLLFLSLAIAIASVLSPPENLLKRLMAHLLTPIITFFIATVSFAWVISYFMGEGLTGYVGSRIPSANLSDPTITMGLMIVTDLVYIYVLWRIVKMLFKSFKTHASSSIFNSLALAAGLGTAAVGGIMSVAKNRGFSNPLSKESRDGMASAMKDERAGGTGGGSQGPVGAQGDTGSQGSSSATGNTPNDYASNSQSSPTVGSRMSRKGKEGDTGNSFMQDLERLSANPAEIGKKAKRARRAVGHKMIDIKYGAKDAMIATGKGLGATYRGIKSAPANAVRGAKYVVSRDGLVQDTITATKATGSAIGNGVKHAGGAVKDATGDAVSYVSEKTGNAVDKAKMAQYKYKKDMYDYESRILRERISRAEIGKGISDTARADTLNQRKALNNSKRRLLKSKYS